VDLALNKLQSKSRREQPASDQTGKSGRQNVEGVRDGNLQLVTTFHSEPLVSSKMLVNVSRRSKSRLELHSEQQKFGPSESA